MLSRKEYELIRPPDVFVVAEGEEDIPSRLKFFAQTGQRKTDHQATRQDASLQSDAAPSRPAGSTFIARQPAITATPYCLKTRTRVVNDILLLTLAATVNTRNWNGRCLEKLLICTVVAWCSSGNSDRNRRTLPAPVGMGSIWPQIRAIGFSDKTGSHLGGRVPEPPARQQRPSQSVLGLRPTRG